MLKDPLPDLASICSFSNSSHRTLVAIGLHQPSQDIFHDILAEGWHSRLMKLFFFRNQKVIHYCKCSGQTGMGNQQPCDIIQWRLWSQTWNKTHSPKTQPFFLKRIIKSTFAQLAKPRQRLRWFFVHDGLRTTTTKSGGCDRQWEDSTDVWGIFHMMKIPLFTNNHEKSSTTYNRS